jgi:4-aminobutyrate aminotransferase-like enzyme
MLNDNDIIKRRKKYIAPSFSVSYDEPLHIVSGSGQYLYDSNGKKYLDAVNNISHVGHCHPKIVEAANDQNQKLNTNTRYLHDSILTYAQNLSETLPEELGVCYFTNSGSESNDLALRIARLYNDSYESIVLSGAYHGHTSSLIDISPYKFSGPGGIGKPNFVQVVPMPDIFRGEHRLTNAKPGEYYLGLLKDAISNIKQKGKRLAFFMVEPIMGCGGQVIIPEDFMRKSFEIVKKAGGLCIVDEVQIGFGRVGSHFWGFEMSGVEPDIITIGKSIGNGHPLSVVITKKHIAESFNNGMEYFNSFGGNPVSCKIGQAVLNVIKEEKLQKNAYETGTYLLDGLKVLKEKHNIIGDVRGKGLFIGIELIKNYDAMIPASIEAGLVVNQLKQKGILISSDGLDHNVLKIKPPLVFNKKNADYLLEILDSVLSNNNFKN